MERGLTRNAAAAIMAAAAVVLMVALLAAPAALAAPHVNLLDADGEAAEHRAVTIGSEAKAYRGELKGTDGGARSWRWTAEPQGILRIGDASSREASIAGIAEGSATVTVTATLPDGTELSDSMLLTSYTWLPRAYPASVSAPGGAALTRGATGDASRDYVRCTAPAGQQLEVVGTCGSGFFRVRLPEEFEFADPDGHTSNRNAFCPRSALAVPAASVRLDRTAVRDAAGRKARLAATVEPAFSTDGVSWSSSDPKVATVDASGNVALLGRGACTVTARAGAASAQAKVTVKPKPAPTKPSAEWRTATSVKLKWSAVDGAASYRVEVRPGKAGPWRLAGSVKGKGRAAPATELEVKRHFKGGSSGATSPIAKSKSYGFRVVPVDPDGDDIGAAGDAGNAGSVGAFVPTKPWAKSRGSKKLKLRWRAAIGARSYDVYTRSVPAKGEKGRKGKWRRAKKGAKGTSATVRGKVSPKRGYEFRVVPKAAGGKALCKKTDSGCKGKVGAYRLEATFVDVGHGDCILVRTPSNAFYLVDGGCDEEYSKADGNKGYTFPETYGVIIKFMGNKRTIDGVTSTHPDYDHVDGLWQLFEKHCNTKGGKDPDKFTIKGVWYPRDAGKAHRGKKKTMADRYSQEKRDGRIRKFIDKANSLCGAGNVHDISTKGRTALKRGKLSIEFVHGKTDYVDKEGGLTAYNLDSAMTLVRYKKFSMLLTGDALGQAISEKEELKALKKAVRKLPGRSVDVLQVNHHGLLGMTGVETVRNEDGSIKTKGYDEQFRDFLHVVRPKRLVVSTETRSKWRDSAGSHDYLKAIRKMFRLMKSYAADPQALPGNSVKLYRTDVGGNVTVTSDGKKGSFKVKAERGKPATVRRVGAGKDKKTGKSKYKGKVENQCTGRRYGKDNRKNEEDGS